MNPSVLAERYHNLCQRTSLSLDMYEHLPTFASAVEALDAETIIELGVRYGVSTIGWLYGLQSKEHGGGHLWSVDCSFPIAMTDEYENLLDPQGPLGVVDYWTFILGYDTWDSVLRALPKTCDILFIDTNHVYEETLTELDLYYPRVRTGGRIFLHDTAIETTGNATTPQPPYPVRTAAEEFCEKKGLRFENNPNCFGLGTIYC